MIIRDANIASIKGVAKAGYNKCFSLEKTKLLKRYKIEVEE